MERGHETKQRPRYSSSHKHTHTCTHAHMHTHTHTHTCVTHTRTHTHVSHTPTTNTQGGGSMFLPGFFAAVLALLVVRVRGQDSACKSIFGSNMCYVSTSALCCRVGGVYTCNTISGITCTNCACTGGGGGGGGCGSAEFSCANGKCIPKIFECDGDNDCGHTHMHERRANNHNTLGPPAPAQP